ncbi:hypothetical protein QQS21_008699 [Conoideocrella luteorostrata]|uniref:Uncharacterized protein n=1 Tax=Conoideocrella luteorostrata TaxID=1105319 RepID=A0AAJ0CIE8_9HYPO|nr:hypothetical protein QQS21_008699 [Conoideocrella luteorostrata]
MSAANEGGGAALRLSPKPKLHPLHPSSPPAFDAIVQTSYVIPGTPGNIVSSGVQANFSFFAGTSINSVNNVDAMQSFNIDTLETRRLKSEPQDDDKDILCFLHGDDNGDGGFKGVEFVFVSADSVLGEDEGDIEEEDEAQGRYLELKGGNEEYYAHMGQA